MTDRIDRANYEDRLARVTSYLHEHLDEPIDLAHLAGVACLSPWHWHRIYHAIQGETVAATVRRLRLHRAAGQLAVTSMPIEAIAAKAGYGSASAFGRAFAEAYGMPPATYRSQGDHMRFREAPGDASGEFDVAIVDLPEQALVGVPHRGAYMDIGMAFEALYGELGRRGRLGPGIRSIGIYLDDPTSTAEAELRSIAAASLPALIGVEPPLAACTLRAGPHAVLRHKGPYASMRAAYLWLFGRWLPASGREAADAPIFEEYRNSPRDTSPADLLTDIYLPLSEATR